MLFLKTPFHTAIPRWFQSCIWLGHPSQGRQVLWSDPGRGAGGEFWMKTKASLQLQIILWKPTNEAPFGFSKSVSYIQTLETHLAAAAAKLLQSCPTLCDPIDGSPWGSPIPGILQARTLEWVAISFSNAWKWKVKMKLLSHARLLVTPWTAAYQAPPSMGFSRQEYWSGVPLPSPILLASIAI